MTYSLATARKWCNNSEFALVTASYAGKEVTWTPALLRAKIERTRKLRDKNRDLHRKMRRANRAATGIQERNPGDCHGGRGKAYPAVRGDACALRREAGEVAGEAEAWRAQECRGGCSGAQAQCAGRRCFRRKALGHQDGKRSRAAAGTRRSGGAGVLTCQADKAGLSGARPQCTQPGQARCAQPLTGTAPTESSVAAAVAADNYGRCSAVASGRPEPLPAAAASGCSAR